MNPRLMRALVLLEQKRFDLADRELRAGLFEDPDDPLGHAFLAICLAHLNKLDEALGEAQQAVRLGPTVSFCHYALASVLDDRDEREAAEAAVSEAIRLDPYDASYFAQLAAIRFHRRLWQEALESAEQGLKIEPEHVDCNNLRAMALVKVGRKQEAGQTIASALAREPGNATTHANQGWALLEQGDPKRAAEHFKEALRIDPNSEWARAGIVESLKARHLVYRLMLRYFLWMAKLSTKAQWCVLIGLVVGQMVLSRLSESSPALAIWVTPLVVLLFIFLVLTWIADPLFNLLLRIDPYGRLVLTDAQVTASNWLGGCIVGMLGCLAAGLVVGAGTERGTLLLRGAAQFGLLVLPVAVIIQCTAGPPRKVMSAFALALALIGPGMMAAALVAPKRVSPARAADASERYFIPGAIFSTWIGVGLSQRRQR